MAPRRWVRLLLIDIRKAHTGVMVGGGYKPCLEEMLKSGLLVRELMLEFFSTCRFSDAELGMDDESSRVIASKADLRDYWTGIYSLGDFLTTVPSYTAIKDPLRRLGRKQGAKMSGGHFITRLAEHFGLTTKESLQGLTMVVRDLTLINMVSWVAELDQQPAKVAPPAAPIKDHPTAGIAEIGNKNVGFSAWMAGGLGQLLDARGISYQRYEDSRFTYHKRV
ncbi:hypothetical protein Tco_0434986 [Tanacetum coccineum]